MRRDNSEGRGRIRDEKKTFRGRDEKPATGFKKYRDADKSEAGWTKADGKPMRKRVGKKEEKKYSTAKSPGREGRYSENKNSFRNDEPGRKKTFDDKRESGEGKPFREKSFG